MTIMMMMRAMYLQRSGERSNTTPARSGSDLTSAWWPDVAVVGVDVL